MPTCVSSSSYNTLFGILIATVSVFLLCIAFNLHTYSKAENKILTQTDVRTAKYASQGMLAVVFILLGIVLFMYFGNTTYMVGLYAEVPVAK